jgi:capsid protein
MGIGEMIDGAIAPFAPGWARNRAAARVEFAANRIAGEQVRAYDAAGRGRRTKGWRRDSSSANAENDRARTMLAGAGHDLARNNKYAGSAVRQLTATIWGDGISAQVTHPVKRIQQRAQDEIDRWAESKVDGFGDWYGHGKIAVREMIVGGESLTLWRPDAGGPDGRISGIEGAQLDMSRTSALNDGARVVQGVQFDRDNERTGYWLFDEHPHDMTFTVAGASKFRSIEDVDHVFERLRFGQARGVSWLGAVAMTLRDIGDIEDAMRLQAKVQACLALVVSPGEGQSSSPPARSCVCRTVRAPR